LNFLENREKKRDVDGEMSDLKEPESPKSPKTHDIGTEIGKTLSSVFVESPVALFKTITKAGADEAAFVEAKKKAADEELARANEERASAEEERARVEPEAETARIAERTADAADGTPGPAGVNLPTLSSPDIGKEIQKVLSSVFVEAPRALFNSSAEFIDGIANPAKNKAAKEDHARAETERARDETGPLVDAKAKANSEESEPESLFEQDAAAKSSVLAKGQKDTQSEAVSSGMLLVVSFMAALVGMLAVVAANDPGVEYGVAGNNLWLLRDQARGWVRGVLGYSQNLD
jgi:hypothetical protein